MWEKKKKAVTLETLFWKFHRSPVRSSCFGMIPALKPEENSRLLTAHWVSGRTPRHQGWSWWWHSDWDEVPAASASRKASLWWSLLGCYGPAAYIDDKSQKQDPKFTTETLQRGHDHDLLHTPIELCSFCYREISPENTTLLHSQSQHLKQN